MSNVFEELSQNRQALTQRIARVEATLENKIEQQTKAKKRSVELFGTDNPKELEKIINEAEQYNSQLKERVTQENELIAKVLTLLETGSPVPEHFISKLNDMTGANLPEKKDTSNIKAKDSVEEKKTPTSKPTETSVDESSEINDDLASLEDAISSMPKEEHNPLTALVQNALKKGAEVDESFISDDDVIGEELGIGLDTSEIGTLEEITKQASTPVVNQAPKAPGAFSF